MSTHNIGFYEENKAILVRTHNIGFYEEMAEIIFQLSSNTHFICSSVTFGSIFDPYSRIKRVRSQHPESTKNKQPIILVQLFLKKLGGTCTL